MSVLNTIYPKSFSWNNATYNSGVGGNLRFEYEHSGTPFEDRTADDFYPMFVAITDGKLVVRVRVREVAPTGVYTAALGTKSNASITITGGKSGTGDRNSKTISFVGLVLVGITPGEQGRAEGGSATLVFAHESADGQTSPVS